VKKILIPTDFSENASDALTYALAFLAGKSAEIHVMHVFNLPQTVTSLNYLGTPTGNAALNRATENLSAIEILFNEYSEKNSGKIKVSTILVKGPYSSTINKEAIRLNVDLIIMGTQGANHSFADKVFGTVSTGVTANASCPVLLVPKGYIYKGITNIIFPTALNHEDSYELDIALQLLQPHTVISHVLHIIENQENSNDEEQEKFASYISEHSKAIQTIFYLELAKTIEDVISEYADRHDAEMIIMHKTNQSFWDKLFKRSHTHKMASLINVPLMVIDN